MFTVFDIETTGLSSMNNDVIQFAYVMFDSNNQFVKSDNLYFYYEGMSWDQHVADISHHISLDFLRTQKDKFKENLIKMAAVLNRANVCGHNVVAFDCPFVRNWLKRMGISDFEFGIQQDTMTAFRPLIKQARIKLTKLSGMCGLTEDSINYATKLWFGNIDRVASHDARYDVAATALLTLGGINKKLIMFDKPVIHEEYVEDSDNDEMALDDSVSSATANFDPMGYYIECDGRVIAINHDKTLYAPMVAPDEVDDASLNRSLLCPVKFSKVRDGVYSGESNGISIEVEQWEAKDVVTIKTPFVTTSDTVFPNVQALFSNFK